MHVIKKIFLVLFVILIIIFAVQNSRTTTVELFNWSVTLPISLLVILVYILGMTTGGILFSVIRNLMKPEPKRKTIVHEVED
jgi:putative membrane protein